MDTLTYLELGAAIPEAWKARVDLEAPKWPEKMNTRINEITSLANQLLTIKTATALKIKTTDT